MVTGECWVLRKCEQNQMNRNENVEMDTRKNRKRSPRGRVVKGVGQIDHV